MDIVNLKKLHFFEQNVKIPTYEFYKVNWTSPFNEKYNTFCLHFKFFFKSHALE